MVSGANVLLLDEPTNNLDPGSRAEILSALRRFQGAIVLVTHDEGAVEALGPERVVLLPDGVEDAWSEESPIWWRWPERPRLSRRRACRRRKKKRSFAVVWVADHDFMRDHGERR